ncbi:MAG: hypothetical protein V3U11_06020, partial [Planctomycetota bacterium]
TQQPVGAVFRLRTDQNGDVLVRQIPAGQYLLTLEGRRSTEARIQNPIVNVTAGTFNTHHARTDPYARVTRPVK